MPQLSPLVASLGCQGYVSERVQDNSEPEPEADPSSEVPKEEEPKSYILDFEEGSVVHDVYVEMKAEGVTDSTIDEGYMVDYGHIDQLPKGILTKHHDWQGKRDHIILDKEIYENVLVCLGEQPDSELCQGWLERLQSSSPFQDRSIPFDRGVALYASGLEEKAAEAFQEFIDAHPNHVDAHLGLGLSLYSVGEYGQSERVFRQVIELDPKNRLAYKSLAESLIRQEKLSEAEQAYFEGIKHVPEWDYFYLALGRMYWDQGDLEKAREIYSQQTLNNPNDPTGPFMLGVISEAQGDPVQAEMFYDQALEVSPNDQDYVSLGDTATSWRYYPQHRRAYYRALEINPKNREVYHRLYRSFDWSNRKDLAELQQLLERWIQNIPEDSWGYEKLGKVLESQGKYAEAEKVYRTRLEKFPEENYSYFTLGRLLHEQGQIAEAEEIYRTCLEKFPEEIDPYIWLGDFLRKQGQLVEAEEMFRMAMAKHSGPSSPHIYRLLHATLMDQGKFQEAVDLWHFVHQGYPDRPVSSKVYLAEALLELGRYTEVLDICQGFIDYQETEFVQRKLSYNYARALQGVGRQDEAIEWFRIATVKSGSFDDQVMAHYALAEILREQGNEEEAERLEYEALGLLKEKYFDR